MSCKEGLTEFICSKIKPSCAFVLPSTQVSGGVRVAMKHCSMLIDAGYDAFLLSDRKDDGDVEFDDKKLYVLSTHTVRYLGRLDTVVATLFSTLRFIKSHANIGRAAYLVQNYEPDFYEYDSPLRLEAEASYHASIFGRRPDFLTISLWCEKWLKERYGRVARYARNGIDAAGFSFAWREPFENRKLKILVEGNSNDEYKNVDESFRIVAQLDPDRFEVVYLSYEGKPKSWYKVDDFYHQVPFEKVAEIYHKCDILLKSSKLESFSYPPLEMMATGGLVVVAPNDGNLEYLRDRENCLLYEPGNVQSAVAAIAELSGNDSASKRLRARLVDGGLRTAQARDWENVREEVLALYRPS